MNTFIFLSLACLLTKAACGSAQLVIQNNTPHILGFINRDVKGVEDEQLIQSQATLTLEKHSPSCDIHISLYTMQEKNIFSFPHTSLQEYVCTNNECSIKKNNLAVELNNQTIVLKDPEGTILLPVEQKPDSEVVLKTNQKTIHGTELINLAALKKALKTYYSQGQYQHDLEDLCTKAKEAFAKLEVHDNDVVIFDIDDTALVSYVERDDFSFLWPDKKAFDEFRKEKLWTANKPVFDLYQALYEQGFKIIFMSSRSIKSYERIHNNLTKAGYTKFEQIILKEDSTVATEEWKQAQRKELTKSGLRIVGSIGDRAKDFIGGYTGLQVRLPNHLYN